ncbi:hypothetical protein [Candidatus Uabimicrobium sp. HlEnr_7]|uniref:hypothetical protein n=1 Tax=Candidatus Uabimicrobium helgolandensis TaxID=3095367 RepID=UPI00355826B7
MIAKSKNGIEISIDTEHLKNHLDPDQSGGTFLFSEMDVAIEKISTWLSQVTLPPETSKSFWGDPKPPLGPSTIRTIVECEENVGWHSLVNIREVEDGTKVEWEVRRGYLTKVFPTLTPKLCKTVALIIMRFDQKRLAKKIDSDVSLGICKTKEEHRHWKFIQSPSEWVLITAFPGFLAPPQSDLSFWRLHGFATGPMEELNSN